MHPFGFAQHDLKGLLAGHGNDGGHAHAEHKARRTVLEELDELVAASNKAAATAHGLGESAHPHVHFGGVDVEMLVRTAPGSTQHAQRVGFVHQQHAVVALFEFNDARQIGNVAVHAKQAFGHDDGTLVLAALGLEQFFKGIAIVVGV